MKRLRIDDPDPFVYFARKIRRQLDGCWLWAGAAMDTGYGKASTGESSHRFAYRLYVGPIPPGLCVLHKCDVRLCVRPDHLFLGTRQDNSADMVLKGRARGASSLEDNHNAKLTSAQVVEARQRRAAGEGLRALAREYGVSHTALSHAIRGINWRTLS